MSNEDKLPIEVDLRVIIIIIIIIFILSLYHNAIVWVSSNKRKRKTQKDATERTHMMSYHFDLRILSLYCFK